MQVVALFCTSLIVWLFALTVLANEPSASNTLSQEQFTTNALKQVSSLSQTPGTKTSVPSLIPANTNFREYLGDKLTYHIDPDGSLSIQDYLALQEQGLIEQSRNTSLQFGYRSDVVWLSMPIRNASNIEVRNTLEVRYAPLDFIDIYLIKTDGKIASHASLGDHHFYYERPILSRHHMAPLVFEAKSQYQLVIRLKSVSSVSAPTYLSSMDALYQYEHFTQIAMGMFYGLALGLFFYNLFLFLNIKDVIYLYYIIYVLGYTLFMASLDGLLYQFWPESIDWESRSINIIPWICGMFLALFCRELLQTKHQAPYSDLILRGFFYLYLFGSIAFFFVDLATTAKMNAPVVATNAFVIMGITIVRFFQGNHAASYFFIGMGGFCIGLITVSTGALNFHSNYDLAPAILKMGASLELIMFAIALAQRINRLETEHLQRMAKLKDDFLANTSHELRTPLNGIIGLADSMLSDETGQLSSTSKRNLTLISNSGYRLAGLVNDILDFSKLKQEEISLKKTPINIRYIASAVIELSLPLISHKPIRLINNIDADLPAINADEDRIYQILHNLIGNAIKFTEQGKVILDAKESNKGLIISVSDSGKGISEENFKTIFDSFEQADSSIHKEFGGNGLGLSITKQLVELHDGNIRVKSKLGEGTTFSFNLPEVLTGMYVQKGMIKNLKARAVSGLSKTHTSFYKSHSSNVLPTPYPTDKVLDVSSKSIAHKILVVDDEPINIEVIKNQLADQPYQLIIAANGNDALKLTEQYDFDLILLDIMMPDISGYEVCQKLREKNPKEVLPILMLTAKNQIEDLIKGFKVGANDYLTKPFIKDELLARIHLQLTLKDAITAVTESERKFRSIYNGALEGIFQINPNGNFTGNPAMAEMLGYENPSELNQTISDVSKQLFSEPTQFEGLVKGLASKNKLSQFETQFIRKDKTLIWGSIKINKVYDLEGEILRWEGLVSDISDQKHAEQALFDAYRDIEFRVDQRTNELQVANNQLSQAKELALGTAREKSAFLANMSHEIRTPMNGVIAAAELALELKPAQNIERFLSIIRNSGDSLLSIVDDILDFSKIESRKLVLEKAPYQLDEVFEHLSNVFCTRLKEIGKDVKLITYIEPGLSTHLVGDQKRLIQVLNNLLGNAVKFTETGYIYLEVSQKQKNDSTTKLQFQVKDTGVGIDVNYMMSLFEPFTQADASTSRLYGGSGLGMNIAKKLVTLMGGKIWAESELDLGTSFFFDLETSYQSTENKPALSPLLKGKLVLLINDCIEYAKVYSHYLNYFGLSIEVVKTVPEALLRLKETTPNNASVDLVISNIALSEQEILAFEYPLVSTIPFASSMTDFPSSPHSTHYLLESPFNIASLQGAICAALEIKNIDPDLQSNSNEKHDDDNQFKYLVKRKILLAEDDITNQEIIRAILSKAGVELDTVNNGQEAIDALHNKHYDAVFMDIEMPVLNGYQATQLIRSDMRFDQVPIIGITARALPGDAEKALATGMNSYLTKPISQKKLFSKLTQVLRNSPITTSELNLAEQLLPAIPPSELSQMHQLISQDVIGVNFKQAMQHAELDLPAFQGILMAHYSSNLNAIDDIYRNYHQQDWKTLKKLAHRINGSAAHIGATALKKQAEHIETICTEPMSYIPDERMIDKFAHELKHIQICLRGLSKPQPISGQTPLELPNEEIELEAILKSIQKLISALEASEPSKVKKYFTMLLTYIGAKKTDELNEQITKFNYHEAQNELNRIQITLEENNT